MGGCADGAVFLRLYQNFDFVIHFTLYGETKRVSVETKRVSDFRKRIAAGKRVLCEIDLSPLSSGKFRNGDGRKIKGRSASAILAAALKKHARTDARLPG
jgi:hypothetical protein